MLFRINIKQARNSPRQLQLCRWRPRCLVTVVVVLCRPSRSCVCVVCCRRTLPTVTTLPLSIRRLRFSADRRNLDLPRLDAVNHFVDRHTVPCRPSCRRRTLPTVTILHSLVAVDSLPTSQLFLTTQAFGKVPITVVSNPTALPTI